MTIHEGMDRLITLAADVGVRRLISRWLYLRCVWLADIEVPDRFVLDCWYERATWK